MNSKLMEAVVIFKELGWEAATVDTVWQLPLGTPQQQKTALAGLKSGDWGDVRQIAKNTYGYVSDIDVDERMLALFAVRIGVDARRAAGILYRVGNPVLLTEVIAARGEKYAADFIPLACVSSRRTWAHSASIFGNVAVRLVDRLSLDIPQNVEYMKDWAVYAAVALQLRAEIRYREDDFPRPEVIKKHFISHMAVGVAVGVPATGPFGQVLPAGVKQGWLPQAQAVELVFAALEAAVRPADRKVWLTVLDELEVSEVDFCARAQFLIPLLSAGDSAVVQRLAPLLIMGVEHDLLTEVLTAAFSATTKKARLLVLKAALDRPQPEDCSEIAPWLTMLAGDQDQAIATAAARLMRQWDITTEAALVEEPSLQGWWQKTPPIWQVPAVDLENITPLVLTELAAAIIRRSVLIHDVTTERFLASANAVAYQDPETARISLRGVPTGRHQLTDYLFYWVNKELPRYGADEKKHIRPLLSARDYSVCQRLDKLPVLLSTPSFDDLSITVSDLVTRLEDYQAAGIHALEADLFLALTRLNHATKTPQLTKRLTALTVPVELQSGESTPLTAEKIMLAYLDDPIKEPVFMVDEDGHWSRTDLTMPESLRHFPNRFNRYAYELFSIFPLWGDVSLTSVRWDSEVYHEKGLILRQVARRATPLPPGSTINLLAAQRSTTPDAAEDAMLAVNEAWERGLLRPGVADVVWLDWSTTPPSNLVALVMVLEGIVQEGLLSVVWPVLDKLVAASLKAPRMVPGTAELVELMAAFLPEVELAIRQGLAEKETLDLPAVRALARRGGSSRAVGAAQALEKRLPWVLNPPSEEEAPPMMVMPFGEVWPAKKEVPLPIEDGVKIKVDWVDETAKTKHYLFTLMLPDIADRVFLVEKRGWCYDLEREGQCLAHEVLCGTTAFVRNEDNRVWLHWDEQQQSIVVCRHRNWAEQKDGPLQGGQRSLLPSSLLTVIVGLLAQDGDAIYFAPRLLRHSIEKEWVGAPLVKRAAQVLLQNPIISPAKLVRSLEKDIRLLPVLWPLLTESVQAAGLLVTAGEAPPVWINRVLDVALRYVLYLKEAAVRGLIQPADAAWTGLREIALAKKKSAAIAKAKKLLEGLE